MKCRPPPVRSSLRCGYLWLLLANDVKWWGFDGDAPRSVFRRAATRGALSSTGSGRRRHVCDAARRRQLREVARGWRLDGDAGRRGPGCFFGKGASKRILRRPFGNRVCLRSRGARSPTGLRLPFSTWARRRPRRCPRRRRRSRPDWCNRLRGRRRRRFGLCGRRAPAHEFLRRHPCLLIRGSH